MIENELDNLMQDARNFIEKHRRQKDIFATLLTLERSCDDCGELVLTICRLLDECYKLEKKC